MEEDNKELIYVPQGVKFISDWEDYKIPRGGHFIIDKGVTGCGYTEFCLRNEDNVILCSPRKLLLENKAEQHRKDHNILYLENDLRESGDKEVRDFQLMILEHIQRCQVDLKLPVKFMVTYDSLHHLIEYSNLLRELGDYIIVIDEFQSIFLDSYFKAEVELDVVNDLQDCKNVIYLSATPMLDKYLSRIPEFQSLKFFQLNWKKTGYVENVKILRRRTSSLKSECEKIVNDYLEGRFPMVLDRYNRPVESKEAVFYFNSLREICGVIKSCKLTPKNTIILCSNTPENKKKLRDINFSFGRVPLEGEENPMFIFCTSAIYMGVDFYSTCASSFVFADPNVDSLALDISMDLPQIVGRQRNRDNPFKNNIVLFHKTISKEKELSESNFNKKQKEMKKASIEVLDSFENMSDDAKPFWLKKLKSDIKVSKYSDDFISISRATNKPVYNYLIEIANERAWEVSQKDYQDSITVTKALDDAGFTQEKYESRNEVIVKDFLDNKFFATGVFRERMRLYCEFRDENSEIREIIDCLNNKLDQALPQFKLFYEYYGTSGCKSRSFKESELTRGWRDASKEDKLKVVVLSSFKLGDRFTMKEAKEKLAEIYKGLGITKTAKAKDLEMYFKLSKTSITLPDKTVSNGFKIIKVL